jgi:hypothetical protein
VRVLVFAEGDPPVREGDRFEKLILMSNHFGDLQEPGARATGKK